MKVEEGKYSIAEIVDWYRRNELVVNDEYQRGSGLWPPSAKSYFIDTILKEFPFPKLYFHERLDKETRRPRREIVDGQQRIRTIVDFANGKFSLGKNASGLEGKKFDHLSEDQKDSFFSYTVSVDVIRNADRSDILQMFRRMNAFTLPLNAAEKRHSEYFGEFKDWVNTVLDRIGDILIQWNILTSRQVVRMADAEFVADVSLAIEQGIVSTSPAKLLAIYKDNDVIFQKREIMDKRLMSAFGVVLSDLSELQRTHMTRPHIFHSLICALIHNKYGLVGGLEITGVSPSGTFFADRDRAVMSLRRLAAAHEEKDLSQFNEYVQAAAEGGNRAAQRGIRIKWLCLALQGQIV